MSENNSSNSGESQNSESKSAPFSLIKTGAVLFGILFLLNLCSDKSYEISYELGKKISSNNASEKEWIEFNEKFYKNIEKCPSYEFDKAVKAKAWNPDSVKIENDTLKITSAIPNKENNRKSKLIFTVSGIVTATNGFGATIRTEQEVILFQSLYIYDDKKIARIFCGHN